ncbi:unnamed protein product [Phytomonas sp. Hart1]|nr:unnamed protein product [Phytomonas sp. Hart1]|eukprot:CCW71074.1 unnamed protein product [Phytomonas sp. isolate Hart1]
MSSVPILSKKLRELEKQANFLRNEVTNLEATKRDVLFSESTQNRSEEIQRQSQEEQLQDLSSNFLDRNKSMNRSLQKNRLAFHFPDLVDQANKKIGDVQSTVRTHHELNLEKERLISILGNLDHDVQHLEENYKELLRLNSSNEDGDTRPELFAKSYDELKNELQELVELYRERELLQKQLNNQSSELWRLSTLMQDTVNAYEQKKEAVNVLAEKTAKLQELRDRRIQLEHLEKTKNSQFEKKTNIRPEEEAIKSANNDFNVAIWAMEREDDQLKSNDAAIRHRAMQIAKSQKRLELIGEAVSTGESDGEERVDVEVADHLVSEINAMYDLHAEACAHMDKLDADIEKMEYKVRAINQAILGAKKELRTVNDSRMHKISLLRKEIVREQKANNFNIAALEKEVEKVRKICINKQQLSKGRRSAKMRQTSKA